MVTFVIVHGPMASGKTRNAEALKRYYGCRRVVEWESRQARETPLRNGDLVLTNERPNRLHPPFNFPGAKVVGIRAALRAVKFGALSVRGGV